MDVLEQMMLTVCIAVANGIDTEIHTVFELDGEAEMLEAEREWREGLQWGTWFEFHPAIEWETVGAWWTAMECDAPQQEVA